jgi:short-subunit dehydrogenase
MIIKNILITGASSGIGEALALYYAKQKETENIFICGRNEERLNAVAKSCQEAGHARIRTKIINTTDKSAMEQWITEAEKRCP